MAMANDGASASPKTDAFEMLSRRVTHHRSISQLIVSIEHTDNNAMDAGIVNPSSLVDESTNADSGHASPTAARRAQPISSTPYHANALAHQHQHLRSASDATNDDEELSGCFSHFGTTSPDSEYDEALAFPDSVTILSMCGERPILVERKPDDVDSDANGAAKNPLHPSDRPHIAFQTLYRPPVKFKSIQRRVFIPGEPIVAQIIDHERSVTSHLLNPNLYHIRLRHGPFEWSIKKRYKHIAALHAQLRVFRASLNFPFPSRSHRERRESFRNTYDGRTGPVEQASGETVNGPTTISMNCYRSTAEKTPAVEQSTAGRSAATSADCVDSIVLSAAATKKKAPRKGALPRFPNRPESLVPVEALPERIRALEAYLNAMLNIRLYRNHHETVNFMQVSQLSFVDGLGAAGKEAMILKRAGFTRPGQSGCNCCGCFHGACCVQCNVFCSGRWSQRWMFVRETCFGYVRPKDGSVRCVVLFDQGFDVSTGIYSTGLRNGLQLVTSCREMVVKSWTRRKAREWVAQLKATAHGSARDFTSANPHGSFAPVRAAALAAWFVDGAAYMSAAADAMEAAREEIYIADWWLSPEIHMKRPAVDGDYWRLDQIIKRKAEQGVRIFVMVYKEVELALGINSYYSKQRLVDLHENVRVFRHPDHARIGVFFWAHHEKIVCVDQMYAFVGGIDLCYGRWDDFQHRLTDLGSLTGGPLQRHRSGSVQTWQAQPATKAISPPGSPVLRIDEPDRVGRLPRLKPGDRLIIAAAASAAASEDSIAANGMQSPLPENTKQNTPEMERRNMLDKLKDNMLERGKELMARITTLDANTTADLKSPTVALKEPADDPLPFHTAILNNADGQAKYWIGKDYVNFIIKDLTNLDAPYLDIVDRTVTPRLPWHDVGALVCGASARDVARHFIQRWNAIKLEKARENVAYPYLFPKSYADLVEPDLSAVFPDIRAHRVTCQVLRSISGWSGGFVEQDNVEQSIHDAYVQTITKAQHYVYIENQFFISLDAMSAGGVRVRNQIANALVGRILRAHREQRAFRVYVVMPLLPAFEGDVGGTTGTAIRAITHWNYASMCRGPNSLLARLQTAGISRPADYVSFHSVRTCDVLLGQPVSELIYVHSKLLIADDRVVICGSANINDRSMIGKRDSEIAVLLTDEVFESGCMNGQRFPTGAFAGQLRRFLFREHLGLVEKTPATAAVRIADPVIESFWSGIWQRTSERNTRVFEEVFRCVPSNAVRSFAELKRWQEQPSMARTDPERAINEMKRIQGNLVDIPFEFLRSETLTPPGNTKEGILPTYVWT